MKKRLIFTVLFAAVILSLTTVFAHASDGTVKVSIYIGDTTEPVRIDSVTYTLDGETFTDELEGVNSSIKRSGEISVPEGAVIKSVRVGDAEYKNGGGNTASKRTFIMYKSFPSKIWTLIRTGINSTLIENDRWKLLASGLLTTVEITLGALFLGVILGFLIAAVRSTHDKTGKFRFLDKVCRIYLTVIRGTPVVVQLMIVYFVILASVRNGIIAAIIAFGINSGAYVAEIVRSGIMSVDNGQTEAGRSLGFSHAQTMIYIVIPQAFKNILPALGNEFIALVKETSVAGYVALSDITKAGDAIRSVTYSAFFPLIIVALIYLAIVMGLTKLISIVERRLRNSDH